MIYKLSSELLFEQVQKQMIPSDVLVDVGCGIRPQDLIYSRVHVCVEPYSEYVSVLKEKVRAGELRPSTVIINKTWADIFDIFPEKSVDTIFLSDVIEHLKKEEGKVLLEKSIKLAKRQVVLFTPKGFMPQITYEGNKDAWGYSGGKWQDHLSGWDFEDFDSNWDIYWAEDFHKYDHDGNVYQKPYGAMWCILNISEHNKSYSELIEFEMAVASTAKKVITHNSAFSENVIRFTRILCHVLESKKMTHLFIKIFERLSKFKLKIRK